MNCLAWFIAVQRRALLLHRPGQRKAHVRMAKIRRNQHLCYNRAAHPRVG